MGQRRKTDRQAAYGDRPAAGDRSNRLCRTALGDRPRATRLRRQAKG